MKRHLEAVAIGSARTEVSANIRLMSLFFEQGVPADDDTCVRMMRALPDSSRGEIHINISTEFSVSLSFLDAGLARDFDDNGIGDPDEANPYPDCDAYGADEKALRADFYQRLENGNREVGSIRARATPDGFRQFIQDVRAAARSLCDRGLCPKCPDRATASMRIPRANYCAGCCIAVAILGDSSSSNLQ